MSAGTAEATDELTMDLPANTSALRLIEEKNPDIKHKKYRRSLRVVDGLAPETLSQCDVIGYPLFDVVQYQECNDSQTTMKPNRKIMPSRWRFYDATHHLVYEIQRAFWLRLLNPFASRCFYLNDKKNHKQFVVEDRDSGLLDRLFGSSVSRWTITEGGNELASIQRISLRKRDEQIKTGFFNKLKRLFRGSNWVLLTPGSAPLISPSVYIGLMIIISEHGRGVDS